jgi:DNA-binding PadR family transcriptional regulator
MADLKDELSETMYCILLSLREERHGYGIIQHVEEFTAGYVQLGAGTVYTSLKKLERAGWIDRTRTEDRRHYYALTPRGTQALTDQSHRIARLHAYGKSIT